MGRRRRSYRLWYTRHRALRLRDVVPGERHGVRPPGQLRLLGHVFFVPEGELCAGQVELEHAAGPLVVERDDGTGSGRQAAPPMPRRFRAMEAQHLDACGNGARPLDGGHHFAERRGVAAGEMCLARAACPGMAQAANDDADRFPMGKGRRQGG